MAKKKRKPDGKKSKPRARPQPPSGLPSRRAMEGIMRQLAAGLQGNTTANTPLEQAQSLIDQAFDEPSPARQNQLAHEALQICPDCADAYVLLAEIAPTRKQRLAQYERGVAAGERALGPDIFRDAVGNFWGILDTRPYMRARLGLAHVLWTVGKRDEAVRHLQDMLRLNPNDNQGVRYTLASFLLFLDRDNELAHLLKQYGDEGSAAWAYTKALLAFRQHGDTTDTHKLLQQAIKTNRHIPAYLLGTKFPPAEQPAYYSPGDENEALEYVSGFLASWKGTPGAIAWLRATVAQPKPAPHAKGPGASVKKLLSKLPSTDDVWQCDFRQLPNWMVVADEPIRPWVTLVTNSSGQVLGHQVSEETPSPEMLWDSLAEAMRKPLAGPAHRPATLQVRSGASWDSLQPHFNELGIAVEMLENLDEFNAAFASLAEHMSDENRPGLLEMPGLTPERVRAFYDAAAEFFRQAPWKRVGYEAAIRVECDQFKSGPWFAVLMGQSGLTIGLALYEDLGVLQRMWREEEDDEQNARETVAISVTFNEAWQISTTDLDAATKHHWPVARSDAYPEVFRKERGMSMRSPLPWELELMEGCLRAVPEFVRRREQDDPTSEEFTVSAAGGRLKLGLSWVNEASPEPA